MKKNLDRLDIRILSYLQNNAKTTNQDLADAVGLSPSSCLQRVRRLEEQGFIDRYLAVINLPKLCRNVVCIATITMKEHSKTDFDEFERLIDTIPEVVECYTVSGDFDFILKIVCADMTHYLELNNQLINIGANIESLKTHVIMKENKPFKGYALEGLIAKE